MSEVNDRRSRFQERVRLERLFLAPINDYFGNTVPLAGMTKSAIQNWIARTGTIFGDELAANLGSILFEASYRAELLADNSRDVFERLSGPIPDGIERLADLLSERLHTLDPRPNPA